jgi:hypothetical protein
VRAGVVQGGLRSVRLHGAQRVFDVFGTPDPGAEVIAHGTVRGRGVFPTLPLGFYPSGAFFCDANVLM